MSEASAKLYMELAHIVDSFEESDVETLDRLIKVLMDHFGYVEFPIRGMNKMMQLGYLFQQLESEGNKK